jgi:hypothetical protein
MRFYLILPRAWAAPHASATISKSTRTLPLMNPPTSELAEGQAFRPIRG